MNDVPLPALDQDAVDLMLGKPRPIGVCRYCGGEVYLEGVWPRPMCRRCRKIDMPIRFALESER